MARDRVIRLPLGWTEMALEVDARVMRWDGDDRALAGTPLWGRVWLAAERGGSAERCSPFPVTRFPSTSVPQGE
jgi:hypothetical protein